MKRAGKVFNFIVLLIGLAMIGYYFALGVAVRFGQSLQYLWLLGGLLCVARFLYWRHAARSGRYPNRAIVRILRVLFCLALAFFLAVEGVIVAAGLCDAPQGLDYIVVLGARVNGSTPSGALRNRIQVAAEYLAANPEAIAVLSGGQGADEDLSEARCMYDHLVAAGVNPARLILEDRSTDTSENLRFSRVLIPENASVGLVTNNFHIFRALALARGLGWQGVQGIPVATTAFSIPHHYMREFVGVVYDGLRGNLAL